MKRRIVRILVLLLLLSMAGCGWCWTPTRPSAISEAVRPPKRSICMNGNDSYLSVQATQAAYTRRAPAFFKTLAHSLRVEPVVTTSSIRTMDRPLHSGAA